MIAKLTGTVDDFGPDWAVIDVGGVGYLVHCSAKTLGALGTRGDAVTVHTDLQVSENDMRLIGFASASEREWFRLLTGIQGVGSKMALAVLSALSTEELQRACAGGVSLRNCSGDEISYQRAGETMSCTSLEGAHDYDFEHGQMRVAVEVKTGHVHGRLERHFCQPAHSIASWCARYGFAAAQRVFVLVLFPGGRGDVPIVVPQHGAICRRLDGISTVKCFATGF